MPFTVTTSDEVDAADREVLFALLTEHAESKAALSRYLPLSLMLRDETGATIGGLMGKSLFDWLHVELLAVPEALRGQGIGADLMRRAEAVARERDCIGLWLDTFAFQAPGFYRKLGFSPFGRIEDHPRGAHRDFFMKRLPPA